LRITSRPAEAPPSYVQDVINFEPVPPLPLEASTGGAPDVSSTARMGDGLILAAETRLGGHPIDQSSTFNKTGGFCIGAAAFRTGGHWQSLTKTVGYLAVGLGLRAGAGRSPPRVHC
jgi:hypothetical protein